MLGGERGERLVVADQALAPRLEAAVARGGLRRAALELGRCARGSAPASTSRISWPMYCIWRRFASWLLMRFASSSACEQVRVERHVVQLRLGQLDQRRAERLQLVHFALALRLADNFGIHAIMIAPPCRSATDSPATRASCASLAQAVLERARARRRERLRLRRVRGLRPDRSRCARASPTPSSTTATARIGVTVYFGERPRARRGHASTSDFSRAGARADGRRGARDRAPHRRGRLRRAARARAARARHAGPRSVPPLGHLHRGGDRARASAARRRRSRCRRRSATPRAPRSRRSRRSSCSPTASASSAATPARATTFPAR